MDGVRRRGEAALPWALVSLGPRDNRPGAASSAILAARALGDGPNFIFAGVTQVESFLLLHARGEAV